MRIKQACMAAAVRVGGMSRAQQIGLVAMVPLAPIVLMADSCQVIDSNDTMQYQGGHVDWAHDQWVPIYQGNHCYSVEGPSNPCWESNTVWWEQVSYHKYFMYTGSPTSDVNGYEWVWVREYLGWYSRTCKVYVTVIPSGMTGGEPLGGPCYTLPSGEVIG